MNRHSETSATQQKKDLTAKRSGIASIHDIHETVTSLWTHEQLNRIRELEHFPIRLNRRGIPESAWF
jgi:hypothetical protein